MDEISLVKIVLSLLVLIIPVATYLATEAFMKRMHKSRGRKKKPEA